MNDSNRKNPPPDDFSKTTPFFKVPKDDLPEPDTDYSSDWEKTNYIYTPSPRQTPKNDDDWGKTAVNINLPRQNQQDDDYGKTVIPGQNQPKRDQQSEWGMTQAGFNINQNDFGAPPNQAQNYGATSPFIQIPEAERAKYQNIQTPPPQQSAPSIQNLQQQIPAQPNDNNNKKATIPPWMWFAGVAGLFLLLTTAIIGMYLIFSKSYGYDVVVKGAQPNSDIFVDGTRWNVTSTDGSYKLSGLSAGTHKIEIKNPTTTYEVEQVAGADGDKPKEVVAKTKGKIAEQPKNDECQNIKSGDFAKASQCANSALDKLGDNFSVEDLLRAMNLYIINFDSGKFNIKPNDLQFLEKASGYMKKLPPNVKIEIGGHTDNRGGDAYNQKLSENRAKSVRAALVGLGVKSEMLEERGYGKNKPKDTNDTDDGRFRNRRIEYTAIIR